MTLASHAYLSRQVLHYLTRTMKRVYGAHKRKVCLMCSWKMPAVCPQLLLNTILNLSSREHRVAICAATDSLRHLRVRILHPILDRASSNCPHFCPCPGFFRRLVCRSSLERRTLTIGFPFSERISALDADFPADDRETLRSFAVLRDASAFRWFTHHF